MLILELWRIEVDLFAPKMQCLPLCKHFLQSEIITSNIIPSL